MAMIHHTTLTPSKLDLLTTWLPAQPWYTGGSGALVKSGGFRLDDPADVVGIELMAVGAGPVTYHVPLTYRSEPLPTDDGLIGTMEHGVLGKRWAYDAVHDPVFVAQLLALIQDEAQPQAQSISHTPDHTVAPEFSGREPITACSVSNGTEPTGTDGTVLHIVRVLEPGPAPTSIGHVTATWRLAEGATERGCFAFVR
jgi:hypothetical protein